jgi:predicted DNA-binding protein (UPF0251 family)
MRTMPSDLVTMSAKEIDRLTVIQRVRERRLSQKKAADMLGLSTRQMRRLVKAHRQEGARGLVSKRRGRSANNATSPEFRGRVMALVAERYSDFGPTLAAEKLAESDGLRVSRETLRKWMIGARFWTSRRDRAAQAHQPRPRRECLGELVQIDGCDHDWFEGRGECCSLLVYVDDATGRLMELRFVTTESAFDYFDATKSYLRKHGRPVAFYSDRHSIFRVTREGTRGPNRGVTQQPIIAQGEIVENKRLGAALAVIRTIQDGRDAARLVSRKVSLRAKDRIREARAGATRPSQQHQPGLLPGVTVSSPVAAFFTRFAEEQRSKRKRANDIINERKRQRQIQAALTTDARR